MSWQLTQLESLNARHLFFVALDVYFQGTLWTKIPLGMDKPRYFDSLTLFHPSSLYFILSHSISLHYILMPE